MARMEGILLPGKELRRGPEKGKSHWKGEAGHLSRQDAIEQKTEPVVGL